MPTNKYLFILAQAEASVYIIAHKNRKIIIGISVKLLPAELLVASYKIFTNLWLDFTQGSQFSKLQLYLCTHRNSLPLKSVIFNSLNSPLTTAVPSQGGTGLLTVQKKMHRTIFNISKSETKWKFLLWRTKIFRTELTFPNTEDFFATLHHPFVLNKLTPKSWVANGFPISFQTLILEKFMLHLYFKQHYMHQKFKGKFQISLFKCKVPGREILRYSLNERENGLVTYILGGKSGFTMLHKFTYCACLSLKFTCHILILTWIKSFCTYKPFATLSKYFILLRKIFMTFCSW